MRDSLKRMHKFTHNRQLGAWAFALVTLFSFQASAATETGASKISNQLENHPSPYLALHGTDPVAWQDWSPEVIERAKKENKLILLSSGYFSCHWCHVMQRESYKNAEVAESLNDFFIPVKIDRELEPALDKRLMAYAQATLKRGGWPLNVFMSPDGIPVYAILYQPQPQFLGLLTRLTGIWQEQSERIRQLALEEKELVSYPDAEPKLEANLVTELRTLAVQHILSRADNMQGGFGQSNKFPSVPQLTFLLDSLANSRDPEVIDFVDLTLHAMAENGMRDHLSGGFFRYVVDPDWEIPHFEKMLYDNANLARLYLKAGAVLNNENYTNIARDTLDFMMNEMASDSGAHYASFSAVDSENVEGGYYLWEISQLQAALSEEEYRVFAAVWQTEGPADLEDGHHLRDAQAFAEVANKLEIDEAKVISLLAAAKSKLIEQRNKRILPTDDKLLAGWNGLALSAFSIAAKTLDEPRYRTHAEKIKTFIVETLWADNRLTRSQTKGKLIGSASIEDYAFVSEGLFHWAELSGEKPDYKQSEAVLKQAWERFYQNNTWSYADTSLLPPVDGEEILSEDSSVSPSANIIQSTIALHNAGQLQNADLYQAALSALNRGEGALRGNPFWYASQIGAMQRVNM